MLHIHPLQPWVTHNADTPRLPNVFMRAGVIPKTLMWYKPVNK